MKAKYRNLFLLLITIYVCFSLLPSPTKQVLSQYHLNTVQARLLTLTVILPVIGIWLVALYGFLRFKEYTSLIKNSRDGKAMDKLCDGLLLLALGPPLAAALSAILTFLARTYSGWTGSITIFNNYITLIVMSLGLYFISDGAEQLIALVRKKPSRREQNLLVLLFIILSTFYAHLVINQADGTTLGGRVYYMPNILILATIAIPYLYFWYRGLVGAYYIYYYQKQINGEIYKKSLVYLATGIASVILASILVRFLVSISAKLTALSLTPILLIVYGLLFVSGMGYALIAIGAKRLRKIEEV